MRIGRIIKNLLLVTVVASLTPTLSFSSDISTPIDGNLFQKTYDIFKPKRVISYSDTKVLQEYGLSLIDGRIVKKNSLNDPQEYDHGSLHTGSSISRSSDGYRVILTGNTSRYQHAIFGSTSNATGFTVLKGSTIVSTFTVGEDEVIETKRATIADIIPENKGNEILLTISHKDLGARVEVFSYGGKSLGSSEPIGQSHRWLHVLAVGPFFGKKGMQLALVRTPHIGGVLQFYQWNGKRLEKACEVAGISTHMIGSDNLNMAAVADFDQDGDIELLVPTRAFMTLKVMKYTESALVNVGEFALPGRLNTNIFISDDKKNTVWLGTENGFIVRITDN